MSSLSWDAVLARRLARHHLITPAPSAKLVDVVSAICGVHAQVMPSAELSLGLRIRRFTARDLGAALWERRELVKMHGLRGTVHLVPAREYGWWIAALRATEREGAALDPKRLAYLGMTERELRDASEAIADAVGGRRLTREQLGEEVAKRVGRWAVDRTAGAFGGGTSPVWQAAIGHAALAGTLCFGPPDGARVTFVRPRDWLGSFATPKPEAALRELFVRFLRAYGPASERDFAQWTMLTPARAREVRESAIDEIEAVEVEGQRLWQIADDPAPRSHRASTLLLPRFDAYTVGAYPRDVIAPPALVSKAARTGLLPRRSGSGRAFLFGPMPVLLVDGVVGGIWESKRTSRGIAIRVEAFGSVERARRDALDASARRIGEVFGLDPTLSFGRVSTKPHL